MKMNKVAYDSLNAVIEGLIKYTEVRRIILKKQNFFSPKEVSLTLNN